MNYFGYIVVFDHRFTEDVQTYVCVSHERNYVSLVPIDRMAGACYRTRTYNLETDGSIVAAFHGTKTIFESLRRIGAIQIDPSIYRTQMFSDQLQQTLALMLRALVFANRCLQPIDVLKSRDLTGREVETISETGLFDRWIVLADDGLDSVKVTRTEGKGDIYDVSKTRWTVLADAPGLPSLERLVKRLNGSHPELETYFIKWSTSAHFARTVS